MSLAAVRDIEERRLCDVARDAMAKSNYEQVLARRIIIREARRNPTLLDQLLDLGAWQILRNYIGAERSAATSAPETTATIPRAANDVSPEALFERVERRLFWDRYTLFGGKPIAKATIEELIESAESRQLQATGNIKRANFERRVAAKLRRLHAEESTVENALDIDIVLKMAKEFELAEG